MMETDEIVSKIQRNMNDVNRRGDIIIKITSASRQTPNTVDNIRYIKDNMRGAYAPNQSTPIFVLSIILTKRQIRYMDFFPYILFFLLWIIDISIRISTYIICSHRIQYYSTICYNWCKIMQ